MAGIKRLVLTQVLFKKHNHLFVTALHSMLKRGDPVAIGDGFIGTCLDENFHRLDVILPTIPQNHRLDETTIFEWPLFQTEEIQLQLQRRSGFRPSCQPT